LEIKELSLLVHLIWEFNPHKKVLNAIKLLDLNLDGLITVAEFALLCKHQPLILKPIQKLQKRFRKKIVFNRFWLELTERRYEDFQYQTIFDIVQIYDPSYVISSMDYMTLRPEIPIQFLEQYKFITQKKKLRRKGDIEMPYELKENDNSNTYGFYKDSFVIKDDDSKARGGWVMSRSRSRKVVDLMNADSFISMT